MKKSVPRVSIIVPMYNVENFIETCIRSILQQTFRDFEVIIIDDCSTDRSAEIVRSFDDPRIRLVRQLKNSGESASRNLGLTLARGKYVYFMDDDDAILSQTLEILYQTAEKSQADIVYMNSYFATFEEDFKFPSIIKTRKIFSINPRPRFVSDDLQQRFQEEFLKEHVHCAPWIKIQRRDFLFEHQIFFPNIRLSGDRLFNLAEICHTKKMQVIDFCNYVYHFHPAQTTKSPAKMLVKNSIADMQIAFRYIRKLFASKNLDLSENLRAEFEVESMLYYFQHEIYNYCKRKFNQKQIEELFREVIMQSRSFDSEFTISLLNMLTRCMIRAESRNV